MIRENSPCVAVDALKGFAEVGGHGVGVRDGVVAGLDFDGAVAGAALAVDQVQAPAVARSPSQVMCGRHPARQVGGASSPGAPDGYSLRRGRQAVREW
jgi:hypothetical protein